MAMNFVLQSPCANTEKNCALNANQLSIGNNSYVFNNKIIESAAILFMNVNYLGRIINS